MECRFCKRDFMSLVLITLQPAVSADCLTNFWVGDSYCVGTAAGGVSSTSRDAPHTTVRSTADLPTQSGTVCNCNKWYDVVKGDSCATIVSTLGITLADFLKWNVSWLVPVNPSLTLSDLLSQLYRPTVRPTSGLGIATV